MKPAWSQDCTEDHLRLACEAFGLQSQPLPELFREGESFLYRAQTLSGPALDVALRLTHPEHRTREDLETELRWMEFIARRGVCVPAVHRSEDGQSVEVLTSQDRTWHASALHWAPGQSPRPGQETWNDAMIERWGLQLGRMQRLAVEAGSQFLRFAWDDPRCTVLDEDFVRRMPALAERTSELLTKIKALPRTTQTYGLCHRDLHQGNLLATHDSLTCIDFDDLCQHYFAADLAMPLYYALLFGGRMRASMPKTLRVPSCGDSGEKLPCEPTTWSRCLGFLHSATWNSLRSRTCGTCQPNLLGFDCLASISKRGIHSPTCPGKPGSPRRDRRSPPGPLAQKGPAH